MLCKSLAVAVLAVFMTSAALAHSPEKVRKNAKEQRVEQQARCDKFLARPDNELDKSSPIIQAMLKRCQTQGEDSAERGGDDDHGHH